jgi:hypothetical protein
MDRPHCNPTTEEMLTKLSNAEIEKNMEKKRRKSNLERIGKFKDLDKLNGRVINCESFATNIPIAPEHPGREPH